MEFYGTLGDACWERETLEELFRTGMTGARLNLSHTTLEACAPLLEERFWPAARQAGVEARLIVDLQGPELRVGTLKDPVAMEEGTDILLGAGGSLCLPLRWRPPRWGMRSLWMTAPCC